MQDRDKTQEQLIDELRAMRQRLSAMEATEARLLGTEKALRESEERFRLLYENAPLGYQSLDENGHFLEVNQAWLDTLGYDREEVIGRWFGDFLAPGYQDHFKINFPKFKAAGEIHWVEFEMLRKDGSQVSVAFDGQIGRDEQGRFRQTHCILHDISEIKRSVEALKASESRYRRLFENAQDGILILDLDTGQILDVNPHLINMLGYSHEEFLDTFLWEVSPFKDTALNKEAFARLRQGACVRYEDLPLETSDGQTIDVEFVSNTYSVDGMTFIQCNIRDITERKRAEEELRQQREELQIILDSVPALIFYKDTNNNMVNANKTWLQTFGYTEHDVIGKCLAEFFPTEQAAELFRDDLEVITTGHPKQNILEVIEIDGRPRAFVTDKIPYQNANGDIIGVIGFSQDITDRKLAEEAIRTSEAQLSNALQMAHLGHWEYDVAKDLFTFNDDFYKIFRTTAEQVGGYTMSSADYARRFVHPDDISVVGNEIRKSIEATDPHFSQQLEHRVLYADGEIGHITVRIFLVKDDLGHTIKTYGVNQDITERKRVEQALQDSEQMLKSLLAASPVGILFTQHSKIKWANDAWVTMFGFENEGEYIDQQTEILYSSQEEYQRVRSILYGNLKPGKVSETDARLMRKDGFAIDVHIRVNFLDPSDPAKGTISALSDVSDRKRSEEELQKSEERLELALQGADLGLWDWYVQQGRAVANQRSAEMIGYSLDEIDQSFGFWESLLHPDDKRRALEKVFNHLSSFTVSYEEEYRVRHKSGAWKWILARGKITERDQDGKPLRMTGTYLDITDRKSSEMRVAEANELREKILAASPVGIEVFKANGQCVLVNDAMGRAIGGTKEQLFAQNFRHMATWEAVGLLDDADQVLSTGVDKQREIHVVSTLGKEVWAETRLTRFNSGGEPHLLLVVNDVSESRKAEAALRFEREQLLSIFGSINEVILVIDPRTYEILYANKFTENLFGTDIIGGNCYEKLNGFDSPCEHCANDRLMELQGQPYQWEYHNPVLKRDFLATDRMIRWPDGRDVKFQLAIDITEAKQADQALRESEEKYRAVFDNAGIAITVVDRDSRKLTQANPALVKMLGYSGEELRQLTHLDITHPEDREITKQHVDRVMEGALDSFDLEKRYIKKDGSIIWGHLSVSTIRDAEGNPGAAVGMIADIAERKKAEDAVRKSEEMLELTLQAADVGLWDWNLKTGWAVWNERATRMLGHLPGEVQPNLRAWKSLVHPEDWPHVSEVLNSHLAGRLPLLEVEYRLRCKSGAWKWILGRGKVVEYDEHGKPSRMIGTNLDITERKCAELEKADLREQLIQSQKMESIGTLAGGIAHDFNNLLTVILGFSELIISEKEKGDQEYEDLTKVIHAARTAGDMVQQILAFSRKTETKLRPINLNKEVGQLKKMLSRLIPKTIVVEISLDSGLPTVNADPAQIEQILMNLTVNSRDSMPNGGRLLIKTQTVMLDEKYCRLHLEASQGRHALLVVTDTGVGIDRTTMDRIFEPFYTTKKPGQGTGLGLAMVYGIVKSHGGHIICESELGSGTTFKIYLPAHQAEGEADVTVSSQFSALGAGTILLVDDEEFVRALGQRILEKAGYTVITATNGQEAVELYKDKGNHISLVILDLIMPVMDGNQCITEILRLDPRARVLIASGYSPDGIVRETLEGGAKGFVRKPYNVKQLLKTVRDALKEK